MKNKITENEKLQLVGLLTLAKQHAKIVSQAEDAMAVLLEADDKYGSGVDWLYDEVYENRPINIDELLKKMKVEVVNESTNS